MCIFSLQFSARFNTAFGQDVYICGNIHQLGSWNPQKSLKLYTDQSLYPIWKSYKSINVKNQTKLEFKLCVLDSSGNLIRWQCLPANQNRKLVVNCSMQVTFSENNEFIQSRPFFTAPIQYHKAKAFDIFNGRYIDLESLQDSDSSSGKDFWNQVKRINEDNSSHYLNFISSMQKNVQYQSEHQIQFCLKDLNHTYKLPIQKDPKSAQMIQNFYIKLTSEEKIEHQCPQDQQENINQDRPQLEKIHYSKPMRDQLIFYKEALDEKLKSLVSNTRLVVHILLSFQKKKLIKQLLLLKGNWKLVLHIPKHMIEEAINLLQFGVNMFIFENQDSLKQFISSCTNHKYSVNMLKIGLFEVQLLNYRSTLLYYTNISSQKFLKHFQDCTYREIQSTLEKINKNLSFITQYSISDGFLKERFNLTNVINQDRPSKRFIMLLVQNLKDLNLKTIRYLISLSDKKNHQVYIFQKDPLTDVEKLLPSSIKNKILVLSSDGQIYCSRQRHVNIYEKLCVPIDRIIEQLDKIAESLEDQTRCKLQKTGTSLEIYFQMDQISQYIRKYIIDQVRAINSKTIHKLTISQNSLTHKITIKPYCISSKFFFKTIMRDFMKISLQNVKNNLFFIDFSGDDRIMNFFDKELVNYKENVYDYYGFYCRLGKYFERNYIKPVINQCMFIQLLDKLNQSSYNHKTQKIKGKTDLNYKNRYSDFYQIHTP